MCGNCCNYIQLNDYWKQKFNLNVEKNAYISITNFSELLWPNEKLTVKEVNSIVQELNMDVIVLDETIDEKDDRFFEQMRSFFKYCFSDVREGLTDIVKAVGTIVPEEIMDRVRNAANEQADANEKINPTPYGNYNWLEMEAKQYNCGEGIYMRIRFHDISVTALSSD
jgi:hypothetical protein